MFKSILLPIDLNADASWLKALPTAATLCKAFGAKLHVMNVVPAFGSGVVANYFPQDFEEKTLQAAEKHLEEFGEQHIKPLGIEYEVHLAHGSIYREVLKADEKLDCDLIVMASHRPEITDYLLGPNAERVVRHASCSVMVVRN